MRKNNINKLLFLILLLTLSGCVYYRFLKVKYQLGNFDRNFAIDDKGGLSVEFKNPVLEAGDIVWLMSAEPDYKHDSENEKVWTYILKKRYLRSKREKGNFDIPVKFIIEKGKIKKVTLPERFLKYFSMSLFKNLLNSFGRADISKFHKEAKSSVKQSNEYKLPTTKEISEVLGIPYYTKNEKSDLIYVYKYYINAKGKPDRPGVSFIYHFREKDRVLKSVKSNVKGVDIAIDFSDALGK